MSSPSPDGDHTTLVRDDETKPPLTVKLASPRGFCAGVERAIRTVEDALAEFGAPVYVRHEIVHNAHVVNRLKAMGARFVDELKEAPDDRPVIFSAHGAPQSVYEEATRRKMIAIDATCPLVLKIHNAIRHHAARGVHVILIGHEGHPEVVGALGQAPDGAVTLIETPEDAQTTLLPDKPLAYVTQTTLSVDETAEIIDILYRRFPRMTAPSRADICYATSNRQAAVKAIAPDVDAFFVIGDPESSNSRRLVETARANGAPFAMLTPSPAAFDCAVVNEAHCIGLSAGASAPEELVETLLAKLATIRDLRVETVDVAEENVTFKQPSQLAG